VVDLESKFEMKLREAGLLPYLVSEKSQFLDLESNIFVELVVRDSTKLPEFGRIAAEVKAEFKGPINVIVRAIWDIESVEDPLQAYDMKTGAPRAAVQYPVKLRSGEGKQLVWVEVTWLANETFEQHGFNPDAIKRVVRDFVASQLRKGGASYWDPIRFPHLEISGDMASYIASTTSATTSGNRIGC
jgi:hypothetical protein